MQIDQYKNEPIYEQIYSQYVDYISRGILVENEKLPSVRKLSASLHINPNTVVKAYRMLEERGFIYSMPGKGSFVSDRREAQIEKMNEEVQELINQLIIKCKYAKISLTVLIEQLQTKWEEKNYDTD